jgi:hypothetical protein
MQIATFASGPLRCDHSSKSNGNDNDNDNYKSQTFMTQASMTQASMTQAFRLPVSRS